MPRLGSIVQKGKFAAWALRVRVTALNSVDLPTLGNPTIPALSIRRGKLPNPGEEASATDVVQPSRSVAGSSGAEAAFPGDRITKYEYLLCRTSFDGSLRSEGKFGLPWTFFITLPVYEAVSQVI